MPQPQKPLSLHQFLGEFGTVEQCLAFLFKFRFGPDYPCPRCVRKTKWVRMNALRAYGCQRCGYHLRPTSNTIFQNSKIPLTAWFHAIWIMTLSRHGLSMMFSRRYFGYSHKACWRMLTLIRSHMIANCVEERFGGPGKIVEVDETLLTTVRSRDDRSKRRTVIFGITDRQRVFTIALSGRKKRRIFEIIKAHVAPGTTILTDGWLGYRDLANHGYDHRFVNHKMGEWLSADGTSTLYIDAYWAYLKRFIRGTHLHIGESYVNHYLKECEFRFNHRRRPADMLQILLKNHPPLAPYKGKVLAPQRRSRAGGNMSGPIEIEPPQVRRHNS